jgi:hypothetical protein
VPPVRGAAPHFPAPLADIPRGDDPPDPPAVGSADESVGHGRQASPTSPLSAVPLRGRPPRTPGCRLTPTKARVTAPVRGGLHPPSCSVRGSTPKCHDEALLPRKRAECHAKDLPTRGNHTGSLAAKSARDQSLRWTGESLRDGFDRWHAEWGGGGESARVRTARGVIAGRLRAGDPLRPLPARRISWGGCPTW